MDNDESPGPIQELTASRARFVSELGERLAVLRHGLARMAGTGEPGAELNSVRRRLHALAAAADVLRFSSTAEALGWAEAALAGPNQATPSTPARERVVRILDLLPSLVLGAVPDAGRELELELARPPHEPLCIVVFGNAALEALLHKAGPLHAPETHSTDDTTKILELVARLSPDVLLVDGDHEHAGDLVPRLRQASGARVPLIAVGTFDRHEPMLRLIRRGVSRILPQPVDAGTLQRTVRQASMLRAPEPAQPAQFRQLTVDELVAAIGAEARKAFGDASGPGRVPGTFDFGSGTEVLAALWAAFARLRGLAILGAGGAVRFPPSGPNGAIPLAPLATGPTRSAPPAPKSENVSLAGRRVVVSASDPGVRALLARTLEGIGALVMPARDGLHALELAEQHWPDALVADALMPGLDGFELCRRLRADIALRDTPVALVTWKDELLDRARHVDATLGSAAGAIEPWSVASELEDALFARATLERRLAQHERVRGRLDGMTPRLLLQLVCGRAPNTLLSLQSGSVSFELAVCDGHVVSARGYVEQRERALGQAALGAFLGMQTGRFGLSPLGEAPPVQFTGDLMTLLEPILIRSRRAREVLESPQRDAVERVAIDPLAAAAYLEDSGGKQRSIVARLSSGEAPRALATPSIWNEAAVAPVDGTMLELAQRGAITALFDAAGRDLTSGAGAMGTPGRARIETAAGPASSSAALLELGEVVRQAVSRTPDPPLTEAAATAQGTAARDTAARDTAARDTAARDTAARDTAARDTTARDTAAKDTDAAAHGALLTSSEAQQNDASVDAGDVRDHALRDEPARHAASRETDAHDHPEDSDVGAAELADRVDESDADAEGEGWPPSPAARLRAALVPLSVTLGAAGLAFLAVRALGAGGWQTSSGALRGPAVTLPDAGARGVVVTAAPTPDSPNDDADLLAEQRKVPVDVVFESELLEVPLQARLRPGQGLLEVRTWERQQIYVDGVFMGNYDSRLIPLVPGTYQVLLRDGGHHMERAVEVRAGQRTRLSARPKSSRSP